MPDEVRRFPPPWDIEEVRPQLLHCPTDSGRRGGNLLARDGARRIAANIAKLPVVFYIRGMEITLDLP